MQTNEVTPSALERRIDITVALADVDKEVDSRLKKMARTVKMDGFRPGKVPFKVVAQNYGQQAHYEAMNAAVERALGEKVRELDLRLAGAPSLEPKEGAAEGTMTFVAICEVFPEVVVGDLSAKEIERPTLEVGDAEIDKTIDVLRKQRATFEAGTGPSKEGDRVTIDFTGRKDGEIFEGGQATDFAVMVGGGQMLPEFDAQLQGVSVGDSKTFDLTFPEAYQAPELAGKTVQFEITVRGLEAAKLPEIDDTFAKALGIADGDVTKMREEIRSNLSREVKRRIQTRVRDQVLNALVDVCEFPVPKAMIDAETGRMVENAREDMKKRGMDVSKMPIEASWFTDQAVRRVKLGLIVAEVVKTNSLNAKPEQVRARVEDMAQSYETPADFVQWFYSQKERMAEVEDMVIEENVVAWVLSQAKASDKVVAFDELMANNA